MPLFSLLICDLISCRLSLFSSCLLLPHLNFLPHLNRLCVCVPAYVCVIHSVEPPSGSDVDHHNFHLFSYTTWPFLNRRATYFIHNKLVSLFSFFLLLFASVLLYNGTQHDIPPTDLQCNSIRFIWGSF